MLYLILLIGVGLFVFSLYRNQFYRSQLSKQKQCWNGLEGQNWFFASRNKTVKIPFLDKALDILEKYYEHPMTEITQNLLPVITNVKVNL